LTPENEGVNGVSFADPLLKSITLSSSIATSLTSTTFYIAAFWDGGTSAVTSQITCQVVCGSETISLSGQSPVRLLSADAPGTL
jgi:hypothetical protein